MVLVCSVLGLFLLVGCGAMSGGETMIKMDKDGVANVIKAPKDGVYKLYGNSTTPQASVSLTKGDDVGFVREGEVIYAVAGKDFKTPVKFSLTNSTMYWKVD
jgi:hypothetical protein